jgi:hypothetical protein
MTVRELIQQLRKETYSKQVIIASDPEGNRRYTVDEVTFDSSSNQITIWPAVEVEQ